MTSPGNRVLPGVESQDRGRRPSRGRTTQHVDVAVEGQGAGPPERLREAGRDHGVLGRDVVFLDLAGELPVPEPASDRIQPVPHHGGHRSTHRGRQLGHARPPACPDPPQDRGDRQATAARPSADPAEQVGRARHPDRRGAMRRGNRHLPADSAGNAAPRGDGEDSPRRSMPGRAARRGALRPLDRLHADDDQGRQANQENPEPNWTTLAGVTHVDTFDTPPEAGLIARSRRSSPARRRGTLICVTLGPAG